MPLEPSFLEAEINYQWKTLLCIEMFVLVTLFLVHYLMFLLYRYVMDCLRRIQNLQFYFGECKLPDDVLCLFFDLNKQVLLKLVEMYDDLFSSRVGIISH